MTERPEKPTRITPISSRIRYGSRRVAATTRINAPKGGRLIRVGSPPLRYPKPWDGHDTFINIPNTGQPTTAAKP
jgi:hypothetical protein